MNYLRTSAEISTEALDHNVAQIRKKIGADVKLMIAVKARAYGHGAVRVCSQLEKKADWFAVASLEEGLELREAGIRTPILILGYTSPSQYEALLASNLVPAIYSLHDAEALSEAAVNAGRVARAHIAVDTGMGRIGFLPGELDRSEAASLLPHFEIEGIFSHLACADLRDKTHAMGQVERFKGILDELAARGIRPSLRHLGNSAAIMELPEAHFDMVRAGIITYGVYPSEEVDKTAMDLRPVLSWRARVIHVKELPAGEGISYGATFVTTAEKTRVATVSAGYADGYPRALSGRGRVLIRGRFAPILGRICMDQFMVDVTEIPDAKVEDVVTLIGQDGDERISVEEVADPACRFNYEMLCAISERVPRV